MARCDIENIGRRPHIRRLAELRLPLETPAEKAERALAIVRDLLAEHEGMHPDYPPRVYLNRINPDSLNLWMLYWYHPPDFWNFQAFSEQLNLEIMRRLEAEGIRPALPSTATWQSKPFKA